MNLSAYIFQTHICNGCSVYWLEIISYRLDSETKMEKYTVNSNTDYVSFNNLNIWRNEIYVHTILIS